MAFLVPSLFLSLSLLGSAAPVEAGAPAQAAPAKAAFSKKPRQAQSRNTLSDDLQALMPWQGIYAAGSGLSAPAWRVVVTVEGDLRAGSNAKPGSSPIALLDKKRRKLDPAVLAELMKLADRAWREKRGEGKPNPEYSEVLVLADGAEVFQATGSGPLVGGAAQQLVRRLKEEAAK
jgi:hypothetical protein